MCGGLAGVAQLVSQVERQTASSQHTDSMLWVSVDDDLPEEGEAVLLWDGSCGMLGSIEYIADGEPSAGWSWCRSYTAPDCSSGKAWRCDDAEYDDDYEITHWFRLPAPPSA